jgi:hypothetical protein
LISIVAGAEDDAATLVARAPFIMVVTVRSHAGTEVLEWVEALDWKAYTRALRIHTHEHLAQVERTLAALR